MVDPLVFQLILPNQPCDNHLLDFTRLWDLLLSGHLRHFVHNGDMRIIALHFLIVFGNIPDYVFDLHVLSSVGAAELCRLIVLFELKEIRLDVILCLRNMEVFVLAKDGIIKGDVEIFALFGGNLFVEIVDVVGIGKHGQIVKVTNNRTDQVDLAVN